MKLRRPRATGFYATFRGREYHAVAKGADVVLRSYTGEPVAEGFKPSRIPGVEGILVVERSDLDELSFVRSVCQWRSEPFVIVGVDGESAHVFYVGSRGEWVVQQPGMVRTGKLETHGHLPLSEIDQVYEFVDPLTR